MAATHTYVARFEQLAAARSERPAVCTPTASMTYGALDATANGIAEALGRVGAEPGQRVVLLADQDPTGCAALIGILKTGATCVPVSKREPPARIRQVIEDAGASVMATQAPFRERLAATGLAGLRVVDVDDASPDPARRTPTTDPHHPTVIVYTSGSTGTPKGVILTNTANTRRAGTWARALDITPDDRIALFATFATGQGISGTTLALLSGATLCPFDVRAEGTTRLAAWLRQMGITVYVSSVTLLRTLVDSMDPADRYPDLRVVRFGGERATALDVTRAQARFPDAQLVHGYAANESGVIAYTLIDPTARLAPDAIVPVGTPHVGVTVHVVGDDEREVPTGTTGRIVVRGPNLSPGYWRDPELTERAFAPLPDHPDEPAFRTGDLGRLRPDGQLEHHGRRDHRIKIRGFRIELAAVEAVLLEHADVVAAVVLTRTRANGVDLDLIGYVQARPSRFPTPGVLRSHLAARLPDHMIPSRFVCLDALPLTGSGKVDRKALPDPDTVPSTTAVAGPRSDVEATLLDIWREVLQTDPIGIDDHFLEVGGDSLRATQVAARVEERLQIELRLSDLFDAGTIAKIAAIVESSRDGGREP